MPQLVDPFVPVESGRESKYRSNPGLRLQSKAVPTQSPAKGVSNDFVKVPSPPKEKVPPLDHLRPRYPLQELQIPSKQHQAQKSPKQAKLRPTTKPQSSKLHRPKHRRVLGSFKPLLAAGALLVVSLLLQSAILGELIIGLYAIYALVRRIESRTTFTLALITFSCIVLLLLVDPNETLLKNFAVYAFLLMLVGTASLAIEARA